MKFDFIIGNPPYQEDRFGDNKTFARPIYHKFLENAYKIADSVEMIHPARFLFNAGSTPKDWNEKMLNDSHFKVINYYPRSSDVFLNTDIMGGVTISYRDNKKDFGAIETFTAFSELNSILKKVKGHTNFSSLSKIVFSRTSYRLTEKMHKEHPEAIEALSKGHRYDMSTNILELLPQIFFDKKPKDRFDYIQVYGRDSNKRVCRYIQKKYVNEVKNLGKYKILVPNSNGSGALGEVIPTPLIGDLLIGNPLTGATETFITIGAFESEEEVIAAFKYVKSKFARAMLGILKITQHNPPSTWKYVPLQDFTSASDIDWSKSVGEIDQQLYKKYKLSKNEIAFIETHVKEMK